MANSPPGLVAPMVENARWLLAHFADACNSGRPFDLTNDIIRRRHFAMEPISFLKMDPDTNQIKDVI